MTDGWNWRQPHGTGEQAYPPRRHTAPPDAGAGASPWWSDALADPWRDPASPAAVVLHAPPPPAAQVEPQLEPEPQRAAGLRQVWLVSLVTALLAGALGGALGYTFAARGPAGSVILGAGPGEPGALAERPPESLAGVADRLLPSVVTVQAPHGGGMNVGSGFVASTDGYVITNDHVIADSTAEVSVVFNDGEAARARVVGTDPESDLAVLRVERTGLSPVELGDSDLLAVGDPVLAFGSPLSLANTVTAGIVSALDRPLQAGENGGPVRYYAAIQTDAAVNQGNSGGPLVDAAGRVVGVNSVIKSVQGEREAGNIGLAFAIPINQAKRIAQDIIATGSARRTVLGVQLQNSFRGPTGGARVSVVDEAGPAAAAGLRDGDIIMKLDGRPITQPADLIALVRKYAPGAVVVLEYQRGGSGRSASVTLAADGG